MTDQAVVVAELQTDLRPFSRLLWQRGIRHRILCGVHCMTITAGHPTRIVQTAFPGHTLERTHVSLMAGQAG